MQSKTVSKGIMPRLYLIYLLFVIAGLTIVVRIAMIQFSQGDYWEEQFNKQSIRAVSIPSVKGNIYSSDGSLLATSVPRFDLYFDAMACEEDSIYYKNIDLLAYHLDTLNKYKKSFRSILRNARSNKKRFIPVKKDVSYNDLKIIREFPIFNLGRNAGGLIIEEREKRILPNGDLASRTIGFERAPSFNISLLLSKIPEELFARQADSLAESMYSLFPDQKKEKYQSMLWEAKKNKQKRLFLRKNTTENKLHKMLDFPLVADGLNNWVKIDTVVKEFYVGIEGAFRKELMGKEGSQIRKKMANGMWRPLFDGNQIEPENGCDIISTINLNLQDVAHASLKSHLEIHKAEGGCAVLMEVKTGHIKAMANLKRNANGEYTETYNYAVAAAAEPGSTFKLVSVMAALEDGKIDTSDLIYVADGKRIFYGKPIKDSHREPTDKISLKTVFANSSNVGIAAMIYDAYSKNRQRFIEMLKSMSIDQPTGIEISGENSPQINASARETSLAIGYGISITPLQLLTFYNAVANDGKMVRPMLVSEVRKAGKLLNKFDTKLINPAICSQKTISKAQVLLKSVVEEGTAKALKKSAYTVAGKTGTARVAREDGKGGYIDKTYRAMFVGYFPADAPKYSCIVVVYQPDSVYYASKVAVPVFKEIADKVYASDLEISQRQEKQNLLKTIPITGKGYQKDLASIYRYFGYNKKSPLPNSDFISSQIYAESIKISGIPYRTGKTPDLKGMGARDAVFFSEKNGYKIKINGSGIVISQTPAPGTEYNEGEVISVKLGRI